MGTVQDAVRKAIAERGNEIPESAKKAAEDLFTNIYEKGMSPGEAMGFDPKMLDFAYQHAYKLFESGKYEEALPIFIWLRTLEPFSYRYVFSVAACHHYMKNYDGAIGQYVMCSAIDPENPEPEFYASDCFQALNAPEVAITFLENSLRKGMDDPKYDKIHEFARLTLEKLKNEVPAEGQGE